MTDHTAYSPGTTTRPRVRPRHLLAVGAALGLVSWVALNGGAEPAVIATTQISAPAPAGFTDDGLWLTEAQDNPTITIYTDLSCPYCQDFFAANGEQVETLVAGGDFSVRLVLTEARKESATNHTAIAHYVTAVGRELDPVDTYLSFSDAITDVADDADQGDISQLLRTTLPAEQRALLPEHADLSDRTWEWVRQHTSMMRETTQTVPSVTVDGMPVTVEGLAERTGLPFTD